MAIKLKIETDGTYNTTKIIVNDIELTDLSSFNIWLYKDEDNDSGGNFSASYSKEVKEDNGFTRIDRYELSQKQFEKIKGSASEKDMRENANKILTTIRRKKITDVQFDNMLKKGIRADSLINVINEIITNKETTKGEVNSKMNEKKLERMKKWNVDQAEMELYIKDDEVDIAEAEARGRKGLADEQAEKKLVILTPDEYAEKVKTDVETARTAEKERTDAIAERMTKVDEAKVEVTEYRKSQIEGFAMDEAGETAFTAWLDDIKVGMKDKKPETADEKTARIKKEKSKGRPDFKGENAEEDKDKKTSKDILL